jgi:hypothetical protein
MPRVLRSDELYKACDPELFSFNTTRDLADFKETIGQERAIHSLDLLRNLFAYDALKRTVRNREVKIEDIWAQYRLISTTILKPEAVHLKVKVILVGNPYLYYLLYNLDEEYRELFKVKANFDSRMNRTEENMHKLHLILRLSAGRKTCSL